MALRCAQPSLLPLATALPLTHRVQAGTSSSTGDFDPSFVKKNVFCEKKHNYGTECKITMSFFRCW